MSALSIQPTFPIFTETDGLPLENGYIWIGAANLDPQGNPIAVYWDAALTQPAGQPIRTLNGYPSRSGTPARLYVNSDYSIRVQNSKGSTVYSAPAATERYNGTVISGVNASNVDYSAGGTGAQTRTVEAVLRQTVSLSDYDTLVNALATGKRVLIPHDVTSISVSAADSPNVLPYLHLIDCQVPLTINLASGLHSFASTISNVGQNELITLKGAAPIIASITGVVSVTGTPGDFAVTYSMSSASGISTGDVLRVEDFMPGRTLKASLSNVVYPIVGDLALGFASGAMGAITTSGTTCTLAAGNQNTFLSVGNLVHVKGQTRRIVSLNPAPANTFTVDSAFDLDVSAFQWWYYTAPATGTITAAASTTVTGTLTTFTTQFNIGDLLIVEGQMREIVTITDNVTMTVSTALTCTGAQYSIMRSGILHEGAFEVTGVAGNNVTVKNKSRLKTPPAVGSMSGSAFAIKTVLKQTTAGNGFLFDQDGYIGGIEDIAIQGTGGGTGLLMTGTGATYNQNSSTARVLGKSAVIDFSKGAFLTTGCNLHAQDQMFCGNSDNGIECTDGSSIYFRSGIASHNGGIGLLQSGGYGRISEGRFCGNGAQGTRQDVGSGMYGDEVFAWGNVSHGFMLVNFCGIQWADGFSCANGGNGANFQNGPGGRISRSLFACNGQHNVSITNGRVEGTQCWMTGAKTGQSGLVVSKADFDVSNGALTGNAASGVYGLNMASVSASSAYISDNGVNGIRADDQSRINADTAYNNGNTGANINQQTGGSIMTELNPSGTLQVGSHYRQLATIADNAFVKFYVGDNTIMLQFVSSSSNTLYGLVRARVTSSLSIAIVSGSGFVVTTGVLNGTTGAPGDFTISTAADGYVYIENRVGASRSITLDILGKID